MLLKISLVPALVMVALWSGAWDHCRDSACAGTNTTAGRNSGQTAASCGVPGICAIELQTREDCSFTITEKAPTGPKCESFIRHFRQREGPSRGLLRDCETSIFTKLRDPEMCAGMVVTGGRSSEAATPAEVSLEDGTQQSGGIPATNLTFSDGRKEDIMLSA